MNSKVFVFMSRSYKTIGRFYMKFKAKVSGKVFACRALHGDSNYSICINSDMTVSCNCQDYDGSGHLGNMKEQKFTEIFFGRRAMNFRESLSRGVFPVTNCWSCCELMIIDSTKSEEQLNTARLPTKGIMLENTALCNLSCLGCYREMLLGTRTQKSLSIEDIKTVSMELSHLGVEQINFFNLGEPFLSSDVSEEIKILREQNPKARIITSTNGCYLNTQEKRESALLLDHVYFSIDGCNQETLVKYQVGGDFQTAYKNLKLLVRERNKQADARTVIEWKYVLFRWNDRPSHIKSAIASAKEAQVDIISFWRGGANPSYRSFRYKYHSFYKNIGSKSWKGREIDFRKLSGV